MSCILTIYASLTDEQPEETAEGGGNGGVYIPLRAPPQPQQMTNGKKNKPFLHQLDDLHGRPHTHERSKKWVPLASSHKGKKGKSKSFIAISHFDDSSVLSYQSLCILLTGITRFPSRLITLSCQSGRVSSPYLYIIFDSSFFQLV